MVFTVTRNVACHAWQVAILAYEIKVNIVAIFSLCGFRRSELCGKHDLAELLVRTVNSCVVPQIGIVGSQWMLSDNLIAILDDFVEVCSFGTTVPAVVDLRCTPKISLGQEMCGSLGTLLKRW